MPSRVPSRTTKYAPRWVFDTQLCRGPSMVVVPDPRVPVSCGCLRILMICLDFSFTTVWIPVGTVRQISTTHSGGTWRSRLDRTVILAWTSLTHVNPTPTSSCTIPFGTEPVVPSPLFTREARKLPEIWVCGECFPPLIRVLRATCPWVYCHVLPAIRKGEINQLLQSVKRDSLYCTYSKSQGRS